MGKFRADLRPGAVCGKTYFNRIVGIGLNEQEPELPGTGELDAGSPLKDLVKALKRRSYSSRSAIASYNSRHELSVIGCFAVSSFRPTTNAVQSLS